jgi:maltose/moltooligosaccharide transporter
MHVGKPILSFSQIINMNSGFFGIQYSFGLQQANMSPIYSYLGADESYLPLLWFAFMTQKYGPKYLHGLCLLAAGLGLLALPYLHQQYLFLLPMLGLGLSWASMMGNPYIILAGSIPPDRTGLYMGIFNMFIVIAMLLETFTMNMCYKSWLGNSPINAIRLAGILMILATFSVLFIKIKKDVVVGDSGFIGGEGH